MSGPQAVSEEIKAAAEGVVERVLTAMSGRAYSPRIKLLTIDQVCEVTGLAESTVYEFEAAGKFPKRVKIGKHNRWRESALIAWLDALESTTPRKSAIDNRQ